MSFPISTATTTDCGQFPVLLKILPGIENIIEDFCEKHTVPIVLNLNTNEKIYETCIEKCRR